MNWEQELEARFKDMFDLVETQTGVSEREPLKEFIRKLLKEWGELN